MIYQCQNRQVIRQKKKEYVLPPLMSMASTNPNLLLDSTKRKISKRKEICTAYINYEQSIDFNTPQIVPM